MEYPTDQAVKPAVVLPAALPSDNPDAITEHITARVSVRDKAKVELWQRQTGSNVGTIIRQLIRSAELVETSVIMPAFSFKQGPVANREE